MNNLLLVTTAASSGWIVLLVGIKLMYKAIEDQRGMAIIAIFFWGVTWGTVVMYSTVRAVVMLVEYFGGIAQ